MVFKRGAQKRVILGQGFIYMECGHEPMMEASKLKKRRATSPHSIVLSVSDCGSEGLGFESQQSHV